MSDNIELQVIKSAQGVLETNIDALEALVEQKLKDYTPTNYVGDAESAKKDRAVLNKSADALRRARIDIIAELMKPYDDFTARCKTLEKKIGMASSALDEIVKAKEQAEKDAKMALISELWRIRFDLFGVEKIMNPKWLNKTYTQKTIEADMDALVAKIYGDLKIIERLEDAELLKTLYMDSLDIGIVMARADEMKRNREIVAREAQERAERETEKRLDEQMSDAVETLDRAEKTESVLDLVSGAMEQKVEPIKSDYILSFKANDAQLAMLKIFLTENKITYDSIEKIEF